MLNSILRFLKLEDIRPPNIKGGSMQLLERILQMAMIMVGGIAVARYLGPGKFGQLALAQSVYTIITVAVTMGFDDLILKKIINSPERKSDYVTAASMVRLCLGLITIMIVLFAYLSAGAKSDFPWLLILILSISLPFTALNTNIVCIQADHKLHKLAIPRTAVVFCALSSRLISIGAKTNIVAFATINCLEAIINSITIWRVRSTISKGRVLAKTSLKTVTTILKESWPLMLSSLAVIIYVRIDQIMLAQIVDTKSTGIYAAAARLSEVWFILPTLICANALPHLLRVKKESAELYEKKLDQLVQLLAILAWLIIAGGFFTAPYLIPFLYGGNYIESAAVLKIHIFSAMPAFMGIISEKWLITHGENKLILLRSLVGLTSNIALNILWIPSHGPQGAAWATVVSYIMSVIIILLWTKSTRHLCRSIALGVSFYFIWKKRKH